ncbi:conjugal transfer protein TraG N-terminal domain-containing protein, partial [Thermodesulfovibrio sp. 1176]|uniref:conjugal transfer protein TraG N-terminal domain-containing protein n=1 Tax=Thermodesulfovibrio sp. 1176 TaxID=3043424 RepID=UPI0024822E00
MKKLFLGFIFIYLFLIFSPSMTEAGTWEYITHNGYDAAVKAWTRVGLIFSDNNYKGLFISVIVLGALGIFIATYIRTVTGAKNNGVSWAVPVLAGMAIYTAFILPKEKLIIYDEALNRGPREVSGIPLIIATSAGILNKIEKGFIDIISTSSDPASDYRLNAGGTGWQLIDPPLFRANLPMNVQDTIGEYIRNCVYMELLREGTTLTIDKIANGEVQFNEIIEQSKNPWWYTKEYISKSTGNPATCEQVGTLIINTINQHITDNDGALNAGLKATCASRGFDVTNAASFNACKSLMLSSVQSAFPNQSDLSNIFKQMILAEIMRYVVASDSPGVAMTLMATSQTTSQFIGLGVHANSWIPVLKESLTAVAISITPMILLFAATPLAGRALSLCLGMFVWLAMWGIIDAVIHAFGVDLAQQASSAIKTGSGELGIASMFAWPGYTAKIAATFGALRWSGLMLASVISGMLVKFGGTALAMLAGSVSAMPQSSGAAYGSSLLKNAGGVLQSEILPTQTWSNAAAAMGGSRALMSGLAEKGAGELRGQARFGIAAGADRIESATFGNLMGGAAGGLKTYKDMSIAMSIAGGSNSLDSLSRLKQMGIDINYDRQGNPIVQGSGGGALPVTGTFNPQTGKFDKGIFKVNDSVISSKINQAVTARHAAQFAMSDETFKSWAVDKTKEYFAGQKGQFSESVGRRLDNAFEQHWSESLDNVRNILEKEGFTRTHEGRGTSGLGMDISLKDLKIQDGAGGRLFYDFKTNKIISFKEDTGTITDAKLSKNAEEGIKTAFRDTLYKTADTTFTTESGFRDLKKLAASEGGRASRKADEAWTKAEEFSKQVSIDYAPYLINTMVDKYLGDRTPENYQKAFEMIRDAVARGETDKLMSDLGINFIDPKQVENKINTGKQGIEQKLVDIRKEVEPFIKNPSGDPKAVPIA